MDMTEIATRYLDAWNETDAGVLCKALAQVFAENARFVDPLADVTGLPALEQLVAGAQERFAGMRFSLHGSVDAHHDTARFQWALGRPGADPLVIGFDVITVNPDGRIRTVTGFFDQLPAA
jgi:SnoaL-like domain